MADVPLPELTGDVTADTLAALEVQRLNIARGTPKPSYTVGSHRVSWAEYLKYLDTRIAELRKEIAQSAPWEEIGVAL